MTIFDTGRLYRLIVGAIGLIWALSWSTGCAVSVKVPKIEKAEYIYYIKHFNVETLEIIERYFSYMEPVYFVAGETDDEINLDVFFWDVEGKKHILTDGAINFVRIRNPHYEFPNSIQLE